MKEKFFCDVIKVEPIFQNRLVNCLPKKIVLKNFFLQKKLNFLHMIKKQFLTDIALELGNLRQNVLYKREYEIISSQSSEI